MHTYIVHTKANQDGIAEAALKDRGFNVFRPLAKVKRLKWKKVRECVESLFPSYLFIDCDLTDESWLKVKWTKGVNNFLLIAGKPAIIDPTLVSEIKQRHANGFIAVANPSLDFKPGDKIKVTDGPLQNLEGIYQAPDGEKRSVVLLNLLTSASRIKLDNVFLERTQ